MRFSDFKDFSLRSDISRIKWPWWSKCIVVYYFCHRLPITFLWVRERRWN